MTSRQRLYVIADESFSGEWVEGFRQFTASLAQYADEPVELAVLSEGRIKDVRSVLGKLGGVRSLDVIEPPAAISSAPMSAADFVWTEDGRPNWAVMWEGFCDLALYGGPPHRGEDTALRAVEAPVPFTGEEPMIAEIRRGIWETTGLFAEPAEEPGWIAVTCHSRKMAAWLAACTILENVDARCDEERLFLPASPDFNLKDQVKSIVTVLAKTNHYWQAHIEATEGAAAD